MLSRLGVTAQPSSVESASGMTSPQHSPAPEIDVDGFTRDSAARLLIDSRSDAIPARIRNAALVALTSAPTWDGRILQLIDEHDQPLPDGRFFNMHESLEHAVSPTTTAPDSAAGDPAAVVIQCTGNSYRSREARPAGWVECGSGAIGLFTAVLGSIRAQSEPNYLGVLSMFQSAANGRGVPAQELLKWLANTFTTTDDPRVLKELQLWEYGRSMTPLHDHSICALLCKPDQTSESTQLDGLERLWEYVAATEQLDQDMLLRALQAALSAKGNTASAGTAVARELARHISGTPESREWTICRILEMRPPTPNSAWNAVLPAIIGLIDSTARLSHETIGKALLGCADEGDPARSQVLGAMARYFERTREFGERTIRMSLKRLQHTMPAASMDSCLRAIARRITTGAQLSHEGICDVLLAAQNFPAGPGKEDILFATAQQLARLEPLGQRMISDVLSTIPNADVGPAMGAVLKAAIEHIRVDLNNVVLETFRPLEYGIPFEAGPVRDAVLPALATYVIEARHVSREALLRCLDWMGHVTPGSRADDCARSLLMRIAGAGRLTDEEIRCLAHAMLGMLSRPTMDAALEVMTRGLRSRDHVSIDTIGHALNALSRAKRGAATDQFLEEVLRCMGTRLLDSSATANALAGMRHLHLTGIAEIVARRILDSLDALDHWTQGATLLMLPDLQDMDRCLLRDDFLLAVARKTVALVEVHPECLQQMADRLMEDLHEVSAASVDLLESLLQRLGRREAARRLW